MDTPNNLHNRTNVSTYLCAYKNVKAQTNSSNHTRNDLPKRQSRFHEGEVMRCLLTFWMMVVTLLLFAAYFASKDIHVLYCATVAGTTTSAVYGYYFWRKKK